MGCSTLAAPSHPVWFLCSAIRSKWGGKGSHCLVRDVISIPSPAPVTQVPQEGAGAVAGVVTIVYTQPSGWYFCIFILFPSLWVFAQSEGAERQGGVEGDPQGILAAGGPILVPPAQPSMKTSGFQ